MKPHSFRRAFLFFGLFAAACSVDGKGLGSGDAGSADTGAGGGPTASGGRMGSTGGGAPTSTGGTGTGGAATGGAPATGGHAADGTGGDPGGAGTGGAALPGTGGIDPGTGGAPQPGTGGAATGGGMQPGTGGAATGGRGMGGAGTGGAGMGGGPMTACNAMTCPNGCCMGPMCITNRTDQRCGTAGAACAACGACFQCSNMGTCTADPNAKWDLICVSATVAPNRNGLPWDPATPNQPLPDPFCRLTVEGNNRGVTDTKMETLMPVWNQSITGNSGTNLTTAVLTAANPRWSVSVLDSDGAIDDAICSVSNRLTPADLAAGTVTFMNKESCQSLTLKVACAN